jgi:flavin reductase (DIM6/NTAB) family NADH-FMN oxidoreductase RutF
MSDAAFDAIDWRSCKGNPSEMINGGWMLITPGSMEGWNTMTASWGGFGNIWGMDAAFVFVRPSRHSFGFMERSEGFTLSFFDEGMKRALNVCGSMSGRDGDKAAAAGIAPRPFAVGGRSRVGFDEASLVISCRKVYSQDLDAGRFLDPSIIKNYPKGDIHRGYIGAIEGAWRRRPEPGARGAE